MLLSFSSESVTLEYLSRQSFSGTVKLGGSRLGGISQIQVYDQQLLAITDDRGLHGGPRILKFKLDLNFKKNTKPLEFLSSQKIPLPKNYKIADFEAFYRLKDGRYLLSSEGDFNQKPRVLPFVGIWDGKKKWTDFFQLPTEYLPEITGLQKKGLRNNLGFEGLSVSRDEKQMWLWSESSLLQSKTGDIEVLEYSLLDLKKPTARFNYTREKPQSSSEIFRGLSEAIFVDQDRFLVLERSLEMTATQGRVIKAGLFLYNKNHQSKIKLYHLDGEYAGNWEAMSLHSESQSVNTRLLILASDNNFESGTPTEFLFFRYTQ